MSGLIMKTTKQLYFSGRDIKLAAKILAVAEHLRKTTGNKVSWNEIALDCMSIGLDSPKYKNILKAESKELDQDMLDLPKK